MHSTKKHRNSSGLQDLQQIIITWDFKLGALPRSEDGKIVSFVFIISTINTESMYVHPTLKWVVALVATITVCDAQFTLFQPPPSLYLGLYSDSRSPGGALTEFKRDNHQEGCYTYTRGNSSTEHCRFYGDCCVDPMRVRERLEPGTFSCLKNPAPSGMLQYLS